MRGEFICFMAKMRYPKPPTGWNDIHEQIVNLYNLMSATDESIKRIKFQYVMDKTYLLSTNALLFPSNDDEHGRGIRAYANQLIQNFRRSPNLDKNVKALEGLDYSSVHTLFTSNDIIQDILSSAGMSNDDYDDDYESDDDYYYYKKDGSKAKMSDDDVKEIKRETLEVKRK